MIVRELIRRLQGVPGDYVVGQYFVALLHSPRFQLLDQTIGINIEKRRVAIGLGSSIPVSTDEFAACEELP